MTIYVVTYIGLGNEAYIIGCYDKEEYAKLACGKNNEIQQYKIEEFFLNENSFSI